MATCPPKQVETIAERVAATGRRFVDAPVSGGVVGATAGSLTIMAAAPEDVVAAARPVLEAMGTLVKRADAPEDVAPTVNATLRMAFNTYRPTATLIGQRVIGAKTFGK